MGKWYILWSKYILLIMDKILIFKFYLKILESIMNEKFNNNLKCNYI